MAERLRKDPKQGGGWRGDIYVSEQSGWNEELARELEKEKQAFFQSAQAQVATGDAEKLAAQTAELHRMFAAALEGFRVQQGGISKTIEEVVAAAQRSYLTVTAVPPEVSDALQAQQHEVERIAGAYAEKLRQVLEQQCAQGDTTEKEKQAFSQSAPAQVAAVDLEKLAAQTAEIDRMFATALENFRVQQGGISKTIEEMAAAAQRSYVGAYAEKLRQVLEQQRAQGDLTEKGEQAFLQSDQAQAAAVDVEKLAAQTADSDRLFAAALESFRVQQGGISKTIEEMAAAVHKSYVTVTAMPPDVSDAFREKKHEFEQVVGAYSEILREALEQPLAQGDTKVQERTRSRGSA
jgi:Pyruvate/2-oxoacid:ferredoxin oxidoreductase gamma subunit